MEIHLIPRVHIIWYQSSVPNQVWFILFNSCIWFSSLICDSFFILVNFVCLNSDLWFSQLIIHVIIQEFKSVNSLIDYTNLCFDFQIWIIALIFRFESLHWNQMKPTQESQEDLDPLKSCFKNLDSVRMPWWVCLW
jgi:hypothetical protein